LGVEAKGEAGRGHAPDAPSSDLGWTVAKALAEECGGWAGEEKDAEGGPSFRLLFPLAGPPPAAEGAAPESVPRGRGKVWVVQADAASRETSLRLLRRLGYEAEGFPDGASAVRRLESGAADLAVIDWNLPMLGGKDTALVLRAARPRLKLVFMGAPAKIARDSVPDGAVLLPRFHHIQEFAAAVRDALGPMPPG
jgi:CheY-like chemotaxis protein